MFSNTKNLKLILYFALPFSLQGILVTSLGFIDSLMISSMGDIAIAASGIGARWFWFASLFILSVSAGVSIFWAQLSESKDIDKFKNSIVLGGSLVIVSSLIIGGGFIILPDILSQVVATKGVVTEYSEDYLRIIGGVVIVTGFGLSFDAAIRCLGRPLIPMYSYIAEFMLNVLLNYMLIFGNFGAPELGLVGAGLASLIARSSRVILLFFIIYFSEPRLHLKFSHFSAITDKVSFKLMWVVTWPVITGSFVWAAGNFSFHAIFGHMGEDILAAMSIVTPIEWVALAAMSGIGQGTAVIIGKKLGANEFDEAKVIARDSLFLAGIFGIVIGAILLVSIPYLGNIFSALSLPVTNLLQAILPLVALSVFLRAITSTQICGILKSGGDTKFCLYLDTICQWVIVVPVVAIGALYFQLPLIIIYLLVQLEELIKVIPATIRIKQNKWVRNITG